MNKVNAFFEYIDLIVHVRKIKQIFSKGGYLYDSGWKNSMWNHTVSDSNNRNIPWLTYSFIEFIEPRMSNRMRILEFGSGYSTMWWGDKCKSIDSLENSKKWYEFINNQKRAANNIRIFFVENIDNAVLELCNKEYDVVIVDDSGDRSLHMQQAASVLSDKGVIVLDDSERLEYCDGQQFLKNNGFKKIDFWGLASGISYNKCTSVFYRKDNILDL